jgi:Restriction endonuclease
MSLLETQILNDLAGHLYNFLPGSGNNNFSFPIAAAKVGVAEFWVGGSKRPAILHLLEGTLNARRHRFCPLILAVVTHSIPWRAGKGEPLTIGEIDELNALLLRLEFKIPELHEPAFREALADKPKTPAPPTMPKNDPAAMDALARDLIAISDLEPTPRGFAFEKFLTETFDLFGLAPRGSFRLTGEQIDGSFQLDGATYLLEAKWQGLKIGNRDLQAFAASVHTKSAWTRGLFVSYSGFTPDGLEAFARGNATHIICMEGKELWQVMDRKLDLAEALTRKTRHAAETGQAFVELRTLYPI